MRIEQAGVDPRVLAVIPARGGSKGVPRKNLRPLGGKPLIAWVIRAALDASNLTRTIVSTDDAEIAEVARSLGAEVPFMRPAELATDAARAVPVVQHALLEVEKAEGARYSHVVMLQPTSPFVRPSDIDGAVDLLTRSGADGVISVVDVGGHHPARMKFIEGDRLIDPPFCEAVENQPRQELTPMYIRSGAIYATRRDIVMGGSFKGQDCRAWVIPKDRSVNIDGEEDLRYAEFLLRAGRV
ncbi:MAG: acylneuraminate cytidylyltransferase family protein [Acidobacteria bacterium]|nr:acylneuraminate cytidylyltransferase family protein [Acidobacteriota bacterium]